jgi:hypothetical protein
MNTQTAAVALTASEQPAGNIAALPTLTELEKANAALSAAGERIKQLEGQLNFETSKRISAESARDSLNAQLKAVDENAFLYALRQLDAGAVLDEAAEETSGLFKECRKLSDSGTLALTLKVKPFKGNSLAMIYEAKVKVSLPKPEASPGVIFVADDGKLSREDPQQKVFGFAKGTSRGDRSDPEDRSAYADEPPMRPG